MSTLGHLKPGYQGTAAERGGVTPTAAEIGVTWWETDTDSWFYWSGTAWVAVDWKLGNLIVVSSSGHGDYDNLSDALDAAVADDTILIDAEDSLACNNLTVPDDVHIKGLGRDVTTLVANNATHVLTLGDGCTLRDIYVYQQGTGDAIYITGSDVYMYDVKAVAIGIGSIGVRTIDTGYYFFNCDIAGTAYGLKLDGVNIGGEMLGGRLNGTTADVYLGDNAVCYVDIYNLPVFVSGNLAGSGYVHGWYFTGFGTREMIGSHTTAVNMEENAAAPAAPDANHWQFYFKADGAYVQDDGGVETGPLAEADAGVDPATHTHSKLVASDGAPDPAWSADASGHLIPESGLVLKGKSSNFNDLGTTTLAEMWGNVYLGTSRDIYPSNDPNPVWARHIDYGLTPAEHWLTPGNDDIAWTGWAAYTGFLTPSTATSVDSQLVALNPAASGRWFRYRSYINAETDLRALCGAATYTECGLMVDDGADTGDNLGADNYVRVYLERTGPSAIYNLVVEYRAGGGGATKNTYVTFSPNDMVALQLTYGIGTRWTNWTAQARFGMKNVSPSYNWIFVVNVTGLAWTPARHGLYGRCTVSSDLPTIWDWFDE